MSDEMFTTPQPDRFEHESPIRAFTEWNVTGRYAIGKGFRPSVAHLHVYLDAMERKEGWQIIQIMFADDGERRSMLFRKLPWFDRLTQDLAETDIGEMVIDFETRPEGPVLPTPFVSTAEYPGVTDRDQAERLRDDYRQRHPDITGAWGIDMTIGGEVVPTYDPVMPELREKQEPEDDGFITVPIAKRESTLEQYRADDPINPRHYGGTECAEIGELLTPNAYQTLKYCWRLGEKDDPVIELGKAIWYWKREIGLYGDRTLPVLNRPDFDLEWRIADRSQFTQNIARMLWTGFELGMRPDHRRAILEALEEELHHRQPDDLCTTGLAT